VKKTVFLTKVAEVMKGMISYESMMASLQRSCMRAEAENIALMSAEEEKVDRLISGIAQVSELVVAEDILDIIVLRYLKNTQFLAKIKEDDIDTSGLAEDLEYWKKTLLYKTP
jgi:hypothetical protein